MRRRDVLAGMCVNRRIVMLGIAGAVAMRGIAHAQGRSGLRHIAILLAIAETDPFLPRFVQAVQQGLQSLGWKLDGNLHIDLRVAGFDPEHLRMSAKELIASKSEVILVLSAAEARAVRKESDKIPIVFAGASDPVAEGVVESLARPGGYTTGFINYEPSIATKWLSLLKEMAPALKRVAMVLNVGSISLVGLRQAVVAAAPSLDLTLTTIGDADEATIARGIENFASGAPGGLLVFPGASTAAHRELIVSLATRLRLPGIYPFPGYARAGGLLFYGADQVELFRRAAYYVDRILHGERPSDLPVQAPVKFDFIINNKTARAMGLAVPVTLLAGADEVIE